MPKPQPVPFPFPIFNPYAHSCFNLTTRLRIEAEEPKVPITFFSTLLQWHQSGKLITGKRSALINAVGSGITNSIAYGCVGAVVNRVVRDDEDEDLKRRPKSPFMRNLLHYTTLVTATSISAAITYPLGVVCTWQMNQDDNNTMIQTAKDLRLVKSPFDGVLSGVASSVSFAVVNEFVMSFLAKMVLPRSDSVEDSDSESDSDSDDDSGDASALTGLASFDYEDTRDGITKLFRRHVCSTLIGSLSKFVTKSVLFPLDTIMYRLQAQGCSYRIPIAYDGLRSCATTILDTEGVKGFYKGYNAQALSLVPELLFTLITYGIGVGVIAFVYADHRFPSGDDEDDDDDEEEE